MQISTLRNVGKWGIDLLIFNGNRFHVKLRILSPEICKQSLRMKSWKAEVRAEEETN